MPIRKRDTQEGIVNTADGAGRGNARNRAEGTRMGEKCKRVPVKGVQRAEEVALDIYGGRDTNEKELDWDGRRGYEEEGRWDCTTRPFSGGMVGRF
jgi:hypothetical protein